MDYGTTSTTLLFLFLGHQEALSEMTGKKIDGLCHGELLPYFNQQIRAPPLAPSLLHSLLEQECPCHYGSDKKATVSPFLTDFSVVWCSLRSFKDSSNL
jgi:hypothetical protein